MTDDYDEPIAPEDAPDVIGEKAARLALKGVLLRGILNQNPQHWPGLCTRVKLGYWRARLEVVEQLDGPDLAFRLEVLSSGGYVPIIRAHRAQLGLPRLAGDKARMLALLSEPAPDDGHELG